MFKRPHIAELLARRFPEIIVDEAQDSNAWLLVLLNSLREKGARVTLVGDPDQWHLRIQYGRCNFVAQSEEEVVNSREALSQSFRCNNQIAEAVRNVGGNADFTGVSDGETEWHRAFVVKETSTTYSDCLAAFQRIADKAGVSINSAAVVCRGHAQLESVRGKVNYTKLQGKARRLATAAFLRDSRHDYRAASQTVESIVRELTGDDPLWERIDAERSSKEGMAVALAVWKFVKSPNRLISVSQLGDTWIRSMRTQVGSLIEEIGLQCRVKLGQQIRVTGLSGAQKALPLFESVQEFPNVRLDTIHQVKRREYRRGAGHRQHKIWNSVMSAVRNDDNTEERRLAYVAMTRARHLLVVGVTEGALRQVHRNLVGVGFKGGDVMDAITEPEEQRCCFKIRA